MIPSDNDVFRFDDFELQPSRRSLHQAGSRIAIAPKTFEVLLYLVQNAGRVVTKEELFKSVWPDSFIEEGNLTQHIFGLRKALTDKSRLIVTIPGRGYEFVGKVTAVHAPSAPGPTQTTSDLAPLAPGLASRAITLTQTTEHTHLIFEETSTVLVAAPARRHSDRIVSTLITAMVLVAALAAWGGWRIVHRPSLTSRHELVLADFANKTGDPVFDETLKQGLSVALSQSPYLQLMPASKAAATLKQMTRPPGSPVTPQIARELCIRAGSQIYVAGSIASLGTEYVLGLKALDCRTDDVLAQQQVAASSREGVLGKLGEAASGLRAQLGESVALIRKYDVALGQATTPSLEALQQYTLGLRIAREKGPAADLPYLERAVQLDPNFAMAWRALGIELYGMGDVDRASADYTRAFQLRDHADDAERLRIEASYFLNVTGELDRSVQALENLAETHPDTNILVDLGNGYISQGQYGRANAVFERAHQLNPAFGALYGNWMNALLASQQFDQARKLDANSRPGENDYILHISRYALAWLSRDFAAKSVELNWLANQPGYEYFGLALASESDAYAGHLDQARNLSRQAAAVAIRTDSKEAGVIRQEEAAVREAAFGDVAEARRTAEAGLKLIGRGVGVESEAALAFALAGDSARAEKMADGLAERYSHDTQMQALWLPAIRAQAALDRQEPARAVILLEPASGPIEFAAIGFTINATCLYPTYIRGQAYLALADGPRAATEFTRIIDHSGVVWSCWTGALAHLGLARALALQGNPSAARQEYDTLFALWSTADPNLPILLRARQEYGRLP